MNLEEIALLAGVSRSTVSRVVNDDPQVSRAVRERVQQVIREQNYQPHAAARSLATRRMRIIGLLVPTGLGQIFTDPYFPLLIQGTAEVCNELDYNLTMLIDTSADGSAVEQLFRRVIRGRHVDGLIIASHVVDDPIIARLQEDGFPFVLVGRHMGDRVTYVDIDNRAAAREAVSHLLSHGYRRIAAVCGPNNMIAAIDRYAGYVTAMQEAGVPPDPSMAIYADFTRQGGYRATRELMGRDGWPPQAIFAASDMMAAGVLLALADAGLRVPDDVALMGFDGLAEGATSQPPLSTIAQPVPELGRAAARLLLERIDQPDRAPVQQFLPTAPLYRRSCGCEAIPVALEQGGVQTLTID